MLIELRARSTNGQEPVYQAGFASGNCDSPRPTPVSAHQQLLLALPLGSGRPEILATPALGLSASETPSLKVGSQLPRVAPASDYQEPECTVRPFVLPDRWYWPQTPGPRTARRAASSSVCATPPPPPPFLTHSHSQSKPSRRPLLSLTLASTQTGFRSPVCALKAIIPAWGAVELGGPTVSLQSLFFLFLTNAKHSSQLNPSLKPLKEPLPEKCHRIAFDPEAVGPYPPVRTGGCLDPPAPVPGLKVVLEEPRVSRASVKRSKWQNHSPNHSTESLKSCQR